jgi:phosphatidylglycerophosphatase C
MSSQTPDPSRDHSEPNRRFAFFDVDGTVIAHDSFLLLARLTLRQQPWRIVPILLLSPIFFYTALTKCDRRWAKSALLWSLTCFRGRRATVRFFRAFATKEVIRLWFSEATDTLAELRSRGNSICYVSASGQIWLRHLLNRADPHPKTVIGSRLGFFLGGVVVTSPNCYNEEKLHRIEQHLGTDLQWEAAYSDHVADLPMLLKARHRFVISPKAKHLPHFRRELGESFELLNWRDPTKSS